MTRGIVTTGAIDPASGTPTCSSVDVRAGTGIVRRTETRPWSSSFVSARPSMTAMNWVCSARMPVAHAVVTCGLATRVAAWVADRRLERLLDRRLELDRTEDALDDAVGEGLLDLRLA